MDKKYYAGEIASGVGCAKQECDTPRRDDIKTQIQRSIECFEVQIKEYQEKLRIEKEKLRLINKNKDLEAYLNLNRNNY